MSYTPGFDMAVQFQKVDSNNKYINQSESIIEVADHQSSSDSEEELILVDNKRRVSIRVKNEDSSNNHSGSAIRATNAISRD